MKIYWWNCLPAARDRVIELKKNVRKGGGDAQIGDDEISERRAGIQFVSEERGRIHEYVERQDRAYTDDEDQH